MRYKLPLLSRFRQFLSPYEKVLTEFQNHPGTELYFSSNLQGKSISSTTAMTWAPSSVILLAMIIPISPEPRITIFFPTYSVLAVNKTLCSTCCVNACRSCSRDHDARTCSLTASHRKNDASGFYLCHSVFEFTQITALSSGITSSTMEFNNTSAPSASASSLKCPAYSGPVSSLWK